MNYDEFPTTAPCRTYVMCCPDGQYVAHSWIRLGWEIFKHRCWHLFKHGKWMD
jgi:hypothetical protein